MFENEYNISLADILLMRLCENLSTRNSKPSVNGPVCGSADCDALTQVVQPCDPLNAV